jgi:hypothetical protein
MQTGYVQGNTGVQQPRTENQTKVKLPNTKRKAELVGQTKTKEILQLLIHPLSQVWRNARSTVFEVGLMGAGTVSTLC